MPFKASWVEGLTGFKPKMGRGGGGSAHSYAMWHKRNGYVAHIQTTREAISLIVTVMQNRFGSSLDGSNIMSLFYANCWRIDSYYLFIKAEKDGTLLKIIWDEIEDHFVNNLQISANNVPTLYFF